MRSVLLFLLGITIQLQAAAGPAGTGNPQLRIPAALVTGAPNAMARRQAYFGDLHVHTTYSFDAFAFGTTATPYDAYRYAKGETIQHPAGFDVRLTTPLDFYAVTDHAMFLGVLKAAADTTTEFSKLPHAQPVHDLNREENRTVATIIERMSAFSGFLPNTVAALGDGSLQLDTVHEITREAWADTIRAAEEFYRPGEFTTFVGYEYTTTTQDRGNLHRNVIFRGTDRLPAVPFSRFHGVDPEDLWGWMDGLRAQGIESLAIPHNSNGSNGHMFKMVDSYGMPIDSQYASQRRRNEPLVEITQVKGTSETHPLLSDNDEWADFEIMPYRVATRLLSEPSGSYARNALLRGLALAEKGVVNPYQFGFVGASDTHTGAISDDEANYFSKAGILDSEADLRGGAPLTAERAELVRQAGRMVVKEVEGREYVSGAYETWGASGVTGVWAEANTRDAIYDAFRRKETFATSGPRMRVRFFGSFDYDDSMLASRNLISRAYADGVSMGATLIAEGDQAPVFLVQAMADASSAPLQRVQIVKGWTRDGGHYEKVYDVACADGARPSRRTHRCPDNGAKVDLSTCAFSRDVGAAELVTLWQDPDYEPGVGAFYYLRALENPTCRWSSWDALRAGVSPRPDIPSTIQERAWSSPIWLIPED